MGYNCRVPWVKPLLNLSQHRKRLNWAKEKKGWTVGQWSKSETEKLQSQLASVKSQQNKDAEKHQLLVNSLNEQLQGLTDTQECLESSLIEKENTLSRTSEKLELIDSLREVLSQKEIQCRELSDKLLQATHSLENSTKKCSSFEKQCSELKTEVVDLKQKLNVMKDKAQKQDVSIVMLQTELDQTNEELDKLNTSQLEERAQLIHDLQSCEREIDSLKDALLEKDKEILSLTNNLSEHAEHVTILKQELKLKEESLIQVEKALSKAEQKAMIIRDSQDSDQQVLNNKVSELVEKLKDSEVELETAKKESQSKAAEVEQLIQQAEDDKKTIRDLRRTIQKVTSNHRNHLSECETHIVSLKEQLALSAQKVHESEGLLINEKLQQETYEKELKSFKEEQNKLLTRVEKYNNEVQTLSRRLEEQIKEKLEAVALLENQLQAANQKMVDGRQEFNEELKVRSSENEKLVGELRSKSEGISKLENNLKITETDKQNLEDKLKDVNEELELLKHQVTQLSDEVTSALQLNSSLEGQVHLLTEHKEKLQLEATELAAQLGTMEENTAEMEAEITRLKDSVQKVTSENCQLMQEEQHRKAEVVQLKDTIQALKDQNLSLKHELQKTVSEQSESQELIIRLRAELSNKLGELEAVHSGTEKTTSIMQEKDDNLRKQERSIHQLDIRITEQEKLLKRSNDDNISLQRQVSELENHLHVVAQMNALMENHEQREMALHAINNQYASQAKQASQVLSELQTLKEQNNILNEKIHLSTEEIARLQGEVRRVVAEKEEQEKWMESDKQSLQTEMEESASNERVKLMEDNSSLAAQLENSEQALQASARKLEEISQQFEEQRLQSQQEVKNLQNELTILSKEKETVKKKLHAALVVRKDLLKRIDGYEKQKEEISNTSVLQEELRVVRNQAEAAAQAHEEKLSLLEKKILQNEAESKSLVEQLQSEKQTMQCSLTEKEVRLCETFKSIDDTNIVMEQLQSRAANREKEFEQDRNNLLQKLEQLQDEIKMLHDKLKDKSTASVVDLENELTQIKSEKATLQNKAQAALLARKETLKKAQENEKKLTQELSELHDEHTALLERHHQQRNELKTACLNLDKKLTELDDLRKASTTYLEDLNSLRRLVEEKDKALQDIKMSLQKLQAALVSRKELLKENLLLKEEIQRLSAQEEANEARCSELKSSVLKLKQQNLDLESSASSYIKDRDRSDSEVERILYENRSLSAACDSLKLTIENITQQKQDFSCQLKSLKDSQMEELSKWKSEHSELKQKHESLLQAHRNISTETNKMRQLLEEAKEECQDAHRKIYHHESQTERWQKQAQELQKENDRIKERTDKFTKEKGQRIEELEGENQKLQKELAELDEKHKLEMCKLSNKNQLLEEDMCQLRDSSEELRVKLTEMQLGNSQLAKKLEAAICLLEEKRSESNTCTNNVQFKLDEALSLNNSLTAHIEVQKTEIRAQLDINHLLQKEKSDLCKRIETMQTNHDLQLGEKDNAIKELKDINTKHCQETVVLNEKVRILEDDKSLLQEELENTREISETSKSENQHLETVILENSKRIDELTESVSVLQSQKLQMTAQLAASEETNSRFRREKEQEQLKLVQELEEKLKAVQRGNNDSKNVTKELQELLKEKHQEINQLQQNCIRYQEVILDLEGALKSSQSVCGFLKEEKRKGLDKLSALEESNKQAERELITLRKLHREAEENVKSLESERNQLQQHKDPEETKSSQSIDEPQTHIQNQLQQRIDELEDVKEEESQRLNDLMKQLDTKDLQINTLKRTAETSEAKLSALTSVPHGADASRLWDDLYQKSLNKKDKQLLEQGSMITSVLENMRKTNKELNELQTAKSRLEKTLSDYCVAASAHQRQMFIVSVTNAELSENAEVMAVKVKELNTEVERLEQGKNTLNRQLAEKEDRISQLQHHYEQMVKVNSDTEAQLLLLRTQCDKIQADFEKQEGISIQLKTLLHSKDAEISSLLSSKDGQISEYLEQLHANYRSQASVYEDRLMSLSHQREKADTKARALMAEVKSLQIQVDTSVRDKEQIEAKVELFKNTITSLQSERERLTSDYRTLEAKSQSGSTEVSTDGNSGANIGFKHEIRKLLHQMDDLNSENAMLRAQLLRYREDLNQVLSLKDNQLKVLLRKQQDVIRNLENQKIAAEKQLRDVHLELQEKNEGNLQDTVAAKAAECHDLQQKLLSHKASADELKEKLQLLESETDKKLSKAKDKYDNERDVFECNAELMMTNWQEEADQKLVELTKELLSLKQQLAEAKSQNKDTKAQNESLCKAMAALQNDRDHLIEDFKILRSRFDEELQQTRAALNKAEHSLQDTSSDLNVLAKERDLLLHQLKALKSKDAQAELSKLMDELFKALTEKDKELKQVVLENITYSEQLSSFSRSMASLQNDRDLLMDELAVAKKVTESRQGPIPETILTLNMENKGAVGDLKGQKDGQVLRLKADELQQTAHRDFSSYQEESIHLRSDAEMKDSLPVKETTVSADHRLQEEVVHRLEVERIQLHKDLQHCFHEIQPQDQYIQHLNSKLQQAVEEKATIAAQLRSVSQSLRDTQDRCHWLESQTPGQVQGSVNAEVAPGAPQERSNTTINDSAETSQLRERLLEVDLMLANERARRETAEEALRLAEGRTKTLSRDIQRDFSIEMETEEEWEALSLNPNQPLITQKMKGGMAACRRWLRGRSLYFSKLLTSRTRSRYFFLAYLLMIHVIAVLCLTGYL
ncbi:golgin subfamily B member 1 [Nematolebias whitei]|uniref:golgin subfamily B member 1 n=1 Tax=Nematolebias whitei TaxID=451745 RepID=UPI001899EAD0|nr:golgin subfamily B member 1 [Nematolebias whitei]